MLYGSLYGPPPVRKALWATIQEAFGAAVPGAKFHLHQAGQKNPGALDTRARVEKGLPTYDELKWVSWGGPNGAHLFFSPIAEVHGKCALRQYEMSKTRLNETGFDIFLGFIVGMREMHHIIMPVYDRTSEDERRRALGVVRTLIDECAAEGWGEYRTHIALFDQIAATYSFNDHALMKLSETIKNALDPNGILSPGKNGIWPANYDNNLWKLDASSSASRKAVPRRTGVPPASKY
jgi:hypothetical protein